MIEAEADVRKAQGVFVCKMAYEVAHTIPRTAPTLGTCFSPKILSELGSPMIPWASWRGILVRGALPQLAEPGIPTGEDPIHELRVVPARFNEKIQEVDCCIVSGAECAQRMANFLERRPSV
jgi:hypothetical protein